MIRPPGGGLNRAVLSVDSCYARCPLPAQAATGVRSAGRRIFQASPTRAIRRMT